MDRKIINEADALFVGFHLMTMQPDGEPYGLVRHGALAVRDGVITWLGSASQIESIAESNKVVHGDGRYMTPGLIDCHTHIVYGGQRADEWEQRVRGSSYEAIARRGGGILSTVRATRSASEDELFASAQRRVEYLMREGVTTLEIKSGYGLDTETEFKMLRVASEIGRAMPIDVSTTMLAAHAIPAEYRDRSDDYIDLVCHEMIPATKKMCDAVDVFCESIAFDLPQTIRVFEAAADAGLGIKVHAEQLSHMGAAAEAARRNAWSADHLEYLDATGAAAMAASGTVAVLLPGAFYFLNETQKPPVEALREAGTAIAVATDLNPGSSPLASLLLAVNMACTIFRLTPEEALVGVTRHAAQAIRQHDRLGTLAVGMQADLSIWEIQSPAELAYGIGHNPCREVYKKGEMVFKCD